MNEIILVKAICVRCGMQLMAINEVSVCGNCLNKAKDRVKNCKDVSLK